MTDPLLKIENLHIAFKTHSGMLLALTGIELDVRQGEIFGIVGETGCGKTVTGLSILRLLPESARILSGRILFENEDLLQLDAGRMRRFRGGQAAMIFQDPSASLNPVFTVGSQFLQITRLHLGLSQREARAHAVEMLTAVGLPDIERVLRSYPHQLSGGMQQRVMIALALACKPKLLIADEPTTALDVTIQAQILALIRDLRQKFDISVVLITHNLGVVAKTCDRLAVLYAGRVVETGTTRTIFENPRHPYTIGLMDAIPRPDRRGEKMASIPGSVPANPGDVEGCAFAARCAFAFDRCFIEEPEHYQAGSDHFSACFLEVTGPEIRDEAVRS